MPSRISKSQYRPRGGRASSVIPIVIGITTLSIGLGVAVWRPKAPPPTVVTSVVGNFDTVQLPVPLEPVAIGTKVKTVRFRNESYPRHQLPSGAVKNIETLLEAVAVVPLPAGLPVFEENFSLTAQASNPVLDRIPQGMRAMTIRVDATSSVEGWAGSGSTVDVLLIEKERTSVIAERVKVLSAERSVAPIEGAAAPVVPNTVTLLVTQEQCLAINTAIPMGKIAFALRNTSDDQNWTDTLYTAERLKGSATVVKNTAKPKVRGVIVVKGNQGEKAFALSDDRWINANVIPEGYMMAREGGRILSSGSTGAIIEQPTKEVR